MSAKDSSSLENGRTLKGFIWGQRQYLGRYLFWRIVSVVVITPFPVITQRIVDVSIPEQDLGSLWYYTLLSLGLLLVHFLSMKLAVDSLSVRSQIVVRQLRARIFHKLNFMHFRFLDATQTGRLLSKYAFDTNNIEMTMLMIVTSVMPEILRALLMILALLYINAWLMIFVFIALPIFALVRWRYFHPIEETNYAVRLAREKMTGQANEFISAIKLVRGYGQEQMAKQQLGVASNEYSDKREEQMRLNQGLGYVMFTVVSGISIFAVALSGWLVITDVFTLGAMVALVGALPICMQPVNMITQFSLQYLVGAESYRSIKELIDSGYVEGWQGSEWRDDLQGDVEFDGVSFTYDEEKALVLHGFDLHIKAGEHVALVGPSGSGKSTIVSLMLGFYAPTEGTIRVDGIPQHDLAIRYFRQSCAIVMQDNLLLSGTIADNIRFGQPTASDEKVREAALNANALEFIEDLPDGFETRVGERGVTLSGGQRQRLAIARALLRNPKVLILDEATSALDYESEKVVQEAINRLAKGRTTITIAHRLSTIRAANRIVVLERGRIVAEGAWHELSNQEGAFKDLLDAQT